MKLASVHVRDRVPPPGANVNAGESMFTAAQGYELDYDNGLVTVRREGASQLVPLSNVRWMTPAPAVAKAK